MSLQQPAPCWNCIEATGGGAALKQLTKACSSVTFFHLGGPIPVQELAPFRNCVVATGGGAVLKRSNWGHMSHAVSIWLHGEPPLLAARVCADGKAGRPLALAPEVGSKKQPIRLKIHKTFAFMLCIKSLVS